MAKQNLFEYAVLYHPKPTKDAQGNDTTPKTEIVKSITPVLAGTEKEVQILAAREIGDKYLTKLDDIEIIIRPL